MRNKLWLLLALALLGAGQAQAQYTNIMNGMQFSNMWAANADFTMSQMIQSSRMNALINKNASSAATKPTSPTYKYALSKSDFKFVGQPSEQKNCAALSEKPADKKQLAEACLTILKQIEAMPEFRKNNLSSALTMLLIISLQVTSGKEIGDAEAAALQRGLNDLLVDSGMLNKLKAAEIQSLYETSVMTGGLIAGIAQAGADDGNPQLTKLAGVMAKTVLQSFGVK